jgi:hypothetical protein
VRECYGFRKSVTVEEQLNCDIPIDQYLKMFEDDDFTQTILDSMNVVIRKKKTAILEEAKLKQAAKRQKEVRDKVKKNIKEQKQRKFDNESSSSVNRSNDSSKRHSIKKFKQLKRQESKESKSS